MNKEATTLERPYPGLRAFRTSESPIFCGRSEHRIDLLQKLESNRFLAVVGASGSGKSSLVKAGLLADIEGGLLLSVPQQRCRIIDFRPGLNPFRCMATALAAIFEGPVSEAERMLRSGDGGLVGFLDAATRKYAGHEERDSTPENIEPPILVVYVDQFEELFRFADLDDHEIEKEDFQKERAGFALLDGALNEAQAFVSLLLKSSVQEHYRIYVILSMRSDFLKDVDVYEKLPEAISNSQFLTPLLNRDQMQEAIERPLKRFGARADERLVPLILNQAAPEEDQLPVLQHALSRTWDHACKLWDGEKDCDRIVTVENFRAVGSLAEALEKHADEVMGSLIAPAGSAITQTDVARFFTCLAEFDADGRLTRRPRTVGQIAAESALAESVIKAIADAYRAPGCHLIMPPMEDRKTLEAEDVLDISHESLLRKWPRLTGWMGQERQRASVFRQLKGIISENKWTVPATAIESVRRAIKSFLKGSPVAGWQRRRAAEVLLKDKSFAFTDDWARRYDGERDAIARLLKQVRFESSVRLGTFLVAVVSVGVALQASALKRQEAEEAHLESEAEKARSDAIAAEEAAKSQRLERELAQEKEKSARIAEVATAGGSQQGQEKWQQFIREIATDAPGREVLAQDNLKPLAVNLGLNLGGYEEAVPAPPPMRADLQPSRIESFEVPTLGAKDLYYLGSKEPGLLIRTTQNRVGKFEILYVRRNAKAGFEGKGEVALVFPDAQYVAISPNQGQAVVVDQSGVRFAIASPPEIGPAQEWVTVENAPENSATDLLGVRWLDENRLLFVYGAGCGIVDKATGKLASFVPFKLSGTRNGAAEKMVWVPKRQWLLAAPAGFAKNSVFEIHRDQIGKVGDLTFRMSSPLQRLLVSPLMTSAVATIEQKGSEQARVWNFANLEEAMKLSSAGARPISLDLDLPSDNWMGYSPDGSWFVLSDSTGVLHAWSEQDLRVETSGKLRPATLQFLGHGAGVTAAAWGNRKDGVTFCATGDGSGSVLLWRFPDPDKKKAAARVREVSGLQLIAADLGAEYEVRRDITPVVLPSHKGRVTALAVSRDGRTLASAGQDGGKIFPIVSSIVGEFRKFEKLNRPLAILDSTDASDPRFAKLFSDREAGKGEPKSLDDDAVFLAARWDYALTPRAFLRDHKVMVYKLDVQTGERIKDAEPVAAQPVDWGPAQIDVDSKKVIELSGGLIKRLELEDDGLIEVEIDLLAAATSSTAATGKPAGAAGIEATELKKVVLYLHYFSADTHRKMTELERVFRNKGIRNIILEDGEKVGGKSPSESEVRYHVAADDKRAEGIAQIATDAGLPIEKVEQIHPRWRKNIPFQIEIWPSVDVAPTPPTP